MTIVALCASQRAMTCALRRADGSVVASPADHRLGASLPGAVAELFARCGDTPDQLTEVWVDIGPGSYTGLRVAVTYARFLAEFTSASLSAVTSFELIGSRLAGPIHIALDARRGRIHTARVDRTPEITLVDEPRAIPSGEFVAEIQPGERVVADRSLHELLAPICESRGAELQVIPDYAAADAFDPMLRLRPADVHGIEPLYLMGSYAE